jgi:hypothetical protein
LLLCAIAIGLPTTASVAYWREVGADRVLAQRGEVVTGRVLSKEAVQSRSGRHYRIDYQFESNGGLVLNEGWDLIERSQYDWLQQGGPVSVIFDPFDAAVSQIEYPERAAFRLKTERNGLFAAVVSWILCPAWGVLFAYSTLRRRRLLRYGAIAPARIVDAEARSSRGGQVAALTYRFCDNRGAWINATTREASKYLEGRNSPDLDVAAVWRAPLVFFDPKDSRRNMLYTPSALPEAPWMAGVLDDISAS